MCESITTQSILPYNLKTEFVFSLSFVYVYSIQKNDNWSLSLLSHTFIQVINIAMSPQTLLSPL